MFLYGEAGLFECVAGSGPEGDDRIEGCEVAETVVGVWVAVGKGEAGEEFRVSWKSKR